MLLKATIPYLADPQGRVDIEADLLDAEMQIAPRAGRAGLRKKPGRPSPISARAKKGKRIEDLEIEGPGPPSGAASAWATRTP